MKLCQTLIASKDEIVSSLFDLIVKLGLHQVSADLGVPLQTVDSGGTFQSLVWSHSFAAAVHNQSSSSLEDARQVCMAGPGHGRHLGMSEILATLRKMRSVAFHLAKAR
ncbi:hypothetical protein PoB_006478700 [Plakobranchus ocellatus]|uniref:Uncharacterized protein n=1 Tax=Plakobranchus ocellatus TaxID=259542 RepID=A0AAV4D288_9GAST|nr:hypothetical protein PoB_006478700 [Plakobranchus ocellatus]